MERMKDFVWHHSKMLQTSLAIFSIIIEITIEIIGFITENEVLFVLDYLLSLLLPHFTLVIDTLTWG